MNTNRRMIRKLVVLLLITLLSLSIAACCTSGKAGEEYEYCRTKINSKLVACTGEGYNKRGLANVLAEFDKIEEEWGGKELEKGYPSAPHFILEVPENYKSTENTRYNVEVLKENKDGFYQGLKVTAYEIEPEETSESAESTSEELPVLTIDEIVGTYQTVSTIETRMKGRDEDEEWRVIDETEVTFSYVISAVDDNTILLEFGGVKLGEGIYDPFSCTCDFKVDPEFYEAMHVTPSDDKTMRIIFSKVDGRIQFEQIVVGSDGEPSIAYKV